MLSNSHCSPTPWLLSSTAAPHHPQDCPLKGRNVPGCTMHLRLLASRHRPPPHPYIWPEDSQLGQRRQEGCLSPQASTTISSQRAQNKASSQPRLQNNEELSLDAAWVRHSVATTRNTTQRHKQKGKYPERNTSKDEITKFFSLSTFLCFILSSQLQPKTHSGFWLVQWTSGANSALGLG